MNRRTERPAKSNPDRFLTPSQRVVKRLNAIREASRPDKHEAHAETGIPASSPRPPAAGPHSGSEGGAPLVNARGLDQLSFIAHVRGLGLDTSQLEVHQRPLPPPLAPEVVAAQEEARLAVEARQAACAAVIEAGHIDGRTATPEEVRHRLRSLGVDSPDIEIGFKAVGLPLKPLPGPADHIRIAAGQAADSVLRLLVTGGPVDARRFSREEFAAYRKMTGLVEG